MKFEFLNNKWAKIADQDTYINRLHVSSFDYDSTTEILNISLGEKAIILFVDGKQFNRFKDFVMYGCTL